MNFSFTCQITKELYETSLLEVYDDGQTSVKLSLIVGRVLLGISILISLYTLSFIPAIIGFFIFKILKFLEKSFEQDHNIQYQEIIGQNINVIITDLSICFTSKSLAMNVKWQQVTNAKKSHSFIVLYHYKRVVGIVPLKLLTDEHVKFIIEKSNAARENSSDIVSPPIAIYGEVVMNSPIKYQYTKELYEKFLTEQFTAYLGRTNFFLVGGIILLGGSMLAYLHTFSLVAFIATVAGIIFIMLPLGIKRQINKHINFAESILDDESSVGVTITDLSICFATDNLIRTIKWSHLTNAKKTPNFLILSTARTFTRFIPLNLLTEEEIIFIITKSNCIGEHSGNLALPSKARYREMIMNSPIKYNYTKELYEKYLTEYYAMRFGRTGFILIVGSLLLGGSMLAYLYTSRPVAFIPAIAGVILVMFAIGIRIYIKKLIKAKPSLDDKPSVGVTITDLSICFVADNLIRTIKWSHLTNAQKTSNSLLLFTGETIMGFLPLDILTEEEIIFIITKSNIKIAHKTPPPPPPHK